MLQREDVAGGGGRERTEAFMNARRLVHKGLITRNALRCKDVTKERRKMALAEVCRVDET